PVQFEPRRGYVGLDAGEAVLQDGHLARAMTEIAALRTERRLFDAMATAMPRVAWLAVRSVRLRAFAVRAGLRREAEAEAVGGRRRRLFGLGIEQEPGAEIGRPGNRPG